MSISLKFPDGAERSYDDGVTPLAVAEGISKSLAKKVVAAKIDGAAWDLTRPLEGGGKIEIVMRDSPDGLDIIRHDAAHVLAQAVQELFPGTQVTIGPMTEDGFYYDFARAEPFSTDDFAKIEKRMKEIVDRAKSRSTARSGSKKTPSPTSSRSASSTRPRSSRASSRGRADHGLLAGRQWDDLCRGPHLPSTQANRQGLQADQARRRLLARRPTNNPQLQRIYGTAWATKKDLEAHLTRLEEAEKRDHRKIGKAMDLFHMQEEGRGMIFWHPKGWTLYRTLTNYMRRKLEAAGYDEVKTPQILDHSLWLRSGHWEKFRSDMFVCETDEGEVLAVKPMNCPGHGDGVQPGHAQLPRTAAAHGRVRRLPSQRALRRAARPDARARVHPGRRPHLLPRRPDRGRDDALRPAR